MRKLSFCIAVWVAFLTPLAHGAKSMRIAFVQKGENLPKVAQRCGTSISNLIEENKLAPPYQLFVGQSLMYTKATVAKPTQKPKTSVPVIDTPQIKKRQTTQPIFLPLHKPKRSPKSLALSSKGFIWPVKGKIISKFGDQKQGHINDGINIQATLRSSVMAVDEGDIVYAGNEIKGFGNLVLIKHAGDWTSAYAHNDVLVAKKGDRVQQGQIIAKVGNTGNVSTPQLHFELRKKSTPQNPEKHLH